MVSVAGDLKDLLVIKSKSRYDTFANQYNRIFMVKLLMVCTLIMGVSWYKDSINCIIPDERMEPEFVSPACWIQGMYVYKELRYNIDKVAYFGLPKNMDNEGMIEGTTDLCNLRPKLNEKPNPRCRAMTKTFFLQYQWMPFLIGALAIVYYAPYIAYLYVNSDINSLKDEIKKPERSAQHIATSYLCNQKSSAKRILVARVYMNFLVKLLYLFSNVIALLVLDNVLNNEYIGYGQKWIKWCRLDNAMAYDYMGMRDLPKPGNLLLPPFGYCEVYESARDIKVTLSNQHKFVCELSQHILYQYCLFVLWIGIILGIVITSAEFVQHLLHYCFRREDVVSKRIADKLKYRELEYLELLKRKDVALFAEVMQELKQGLIDEENPREDIPLYPKIPPKPNSIIH